MFHRATPTLIPASSSAKMKGTTRHTTFFSQERRVTKMPVSFFGKIGGSSLRRTYPAVISPPSSYSVSLHFSIRGGFADTEQLGGGKDVSAIGLKGLFT
jgi:hypothetical protein